MTRKKRWRTVRDGLDGKCPSNAAFTTGSHTSKSSRTSLSTNTSTFPKFGNSQAELFSQKDLVDASGRIVSVSRNFTGGRWGIKVPSLNLIHRISLFSVHDTRPDVVQGPTMRGDLCPCRFENTICQCEE